MRVRLFVTCLIDLFRPETAKAAVRVLERRGMDVDVPAAQTCCGQFAYNAGFRDEASAMARHFLDAFDGGDAARPIVGLSGSCTAMVKDIYPDLVGEDPRLFGVRGQVVEFSEFLAQEGGPPADGVGDALPVAFHNGCHMRRMLGVTEAPLDVLRKAGVDPASLRDADQCCGFGGTYAMAEPEVSTSLADAKLERWREANQQGAAALVGADWGCLLHLAGRLSRLGEPAPVLHLADMLDVAETGALAADRVRERGVFYDEGRR